MCIETSKHLHAKKKTKQKKIIIKNENENENIYFCMGIAIFVMKLCWCNLCTTRTNTQEYYIGWNGWYGMVRLADWLDIACSGDILIWNIWCENERHSKPLKPKPKQRIENALCFSHFFCRITLCVCITITTNCS